MIKIECAKEIKLHPRLWWMWLRNRG